MLPAILGLSGEPLSEDERAFFDDAQPAGFILFARNCRDKPQLKALTDSLRDVSGRADVPILIDQEGGRVARLASARMAEIPRRLAVRRALPEGADQRRSKRRGSMPRRSH